MVPTDVIDLAGAAPASDYATVNSNGVLAISTASGVLDLQTSGVAARSLFSVSTDSAGGTDVSLVAPGTRSFTVENEADLNAVLSFIDVGGAGAQSNAAYTITFAGVADGTMSLSGALDAINLMGGSTLTIDGAGDTIDGGYNSSVAGSGTRGFFVYAGAVLLENLTISDAVARGGAGGNGLDGAGGGGMGAGGGVFVAANASVTLSGVSFANDAAIGGAGGSANSATDYGGGGGLGGAGGSGASQGGGGGIGPGATGAKSVPYQSGVGNAGGAGIVLGAASGGAGYSDPSTSNGGAGGANGGGGGSSGSYDNQESGYAGGGGVGGATGPNNFAGAGGFGGGGAGGAQGGAAGGFGGGGGGGEQQTSHTAGDGGFGGGSGGSDTGVGSTAGFGAGSAQQMAGGGGLGAGGDVFVQQGGHAGRARRHAGWRHSDWRRRRFGFGVGRSRGYSG